MNKNKPYPDCDFAFICCPECGGSISRSKYAFRIMGSGKVGMCNECGKEWHVIREDVEEDSELEEQT